LKTGLHTSLLEAHALQASEFPQLSAHASSPDHPPASRSRSTWRSGAGGCDLCAAL